jgi:hypothetical protein
VQRITQRLAQRRSLVKHGDKCERLPMPSTAAEFFENFVLPSRPAVFENAVANWTALQKWVCSITLGCCQSFLALLLLSNTHFYSFVSSSTRTCPT